MIPGIDVSLDQGVISAADCVRLRQEGKRFGVARAVEGLGSIDPRFVANIAGFRAAGIVPCAYFPLHPDLDPVKQAQTHFDGCGGLGSQLGELAPWCDTELLRGRTPAEALAATVAWLNAASVLWGRRVTTYTYPWFLEQMVKGGDPVALKMLAETNLALAAYQSNPPTAPEPWSTAMFWQNSGGAPAPGVVPYHLPNGCPCDTDFFLGDEQAFADAQDPSKG